jgi:hypothetical protein
MDNMYIPPCPLYLVTCCSSNSGIAWSRCSLHSSGTAQAAHQLPPDECFWLTDTDINPSDSADAAARPWLPLVLLLLSCSNCSTTGRYMLVVVRVHVLVESILGVGLFGAHQEGVFSQSH